MPKRKGQRHLPKKHKRIKTKYPVLSFHETSRMYVCLTCKEELHDIIQKEWEVWEIPRHVKKTHKVPNTRDSRMKFIPSWNKEFEKAYIKNLHKKIIFKSGEENDIETSTKSLNKMAREDEERRKRELEAERDSR
jgi:hypothetical protein